MPALRSTDAAGSGGARVQPPRFPRSSGRRLQQGDNASSSSSSGGGGGGSGQLLPGPAQQPAPVILAIAYGGPALAALPGQADVVDASAVNTTRCLRYAEGFDPAAPRVGGGGAVDGAQTLRSLGMPYTRPPLDLSDCWGSVLEVRSAIQRVMVQVGGRRGVARARQGRARPQPKAAGRLAALAAHTPARLLGAAVR